MLAHPQECRFLAQKEALGVVNHSLPCPAAALAHALFRGVAREIVVDLEPRNLTLDRIMFLRLEIFRMIEAAGRNIRPKDADVGGRA